MQRNDLLAWMDLELTSIDDVTRDKITEIAVILTDKDLTVVAEGPDIVIHVPPELFEGISPGAVAIHEANNMQALVAASTTSATEAEAQVLAFLKEHVTEKSTPLCGNTIWMDRHFLRVQMPAVDEYLFSRDDRNVAREVAGRRTRWVAVVAAHLL